MFKKHKNKIIISSLVIIGAILIIIGSLSSKKSSNDSFDFDNYTSKLENKLEDFLKSVDGITKAQVIITLDTSYEQIYGKDGDNYITINKEPVDISMISPKIRGVAIACTNGDSIEIQGRVTEIVSSYLGIPTNRIKIVAIK